MSSIFNEGGGITFYLETRSQLRSEKKRTRFAGHWYFAQNEIISDVYKTGMWLSRERLHRNYFKQLAENSQWVYEDLEGLIKDRARWHDRIKKIRSITTTKWWRLPECVWFKKRKRSFWILPTTFKKKVNKGVSPLLQSANVNHLVIVQRELSCPIRCGYFGIQGS